VDFIGLYEAKTQLSALVDRAAAGEEIVIAKNGVPRARLVAIPRSGEWRVPVGPMVDPPLPDDFNEPPEEFVKLFYGES
jgi:prevent-host-death family protein